MAKYFTWCLKRTFLLGNRLKVYQQPLSMLKTNNFAIQSRHIATPNENQINVDYDEPKKFSEFANDLRNNKTAAITTLMKILSVTKANAKKAVDVYPNFKMLPIKMIRNNFQCLREGGFYKSTIKDNKYLLTDDTETLMKKIQTVQKIDVDINDAAPLFHLSPEELSNFERLSKMEASYLPVRNRIVYLAEKLECDIVTICNILSYNPLILKLPAPKLLTITEYLLEVGMKPQHILNDVHIYNYSIGTIKDKVERAKQVGANPLKPWVVRCHSRVWEKLEEKQAIREAILKPGQSVAEYIRDIFDCDMEQVNYVLEKNPRLRTQNMEKLSMIMRFLQSEGFTIEEIQRAPAAISHSIESITQRCAAFRKVYNRKPALCLFIVSNAKFEKMMAAARSANVDENAS